MKRFVILAHDWPTPHFDLLLEVGSVLRAWRLSTAPLGPVWAEPNFDHRLIYLEFEGPLTDDRGTVTRWDSGFYEGEPGQRVRFDGSKIRGWWEFRESWLIPTPDAG